MVTFFRKDFLIFWRNRKEMIISLITPIIIILVLGFALPDWVENTSKPMEMTVAIVQLDDEVAALEQFQQSLHSQVLSEEVLLGVEQGMNRIEPAQWLKQALGNDQLQSFIDIKELGYDQALEQLENNQLTAAIIIPEGFKLATMTKWLLDIGDGATLNIVADEASIHVSALSTILHDFMNSLNRQAAMQRLLGDEAVIALQEMNQIVVNGDIGEREVIANVQMVTSFQYYALAISIVFGLLMSTTIAAKAVTEKRERIFNRIVLSSSRTTDYLLGKFSSTFVISLAQLIIILLLSHITLHVFPDRSMKFWLGLLSVLILLSLCVGGAAAFFTALVFRMKEDIANGIIFLAIMIAGTIGGSFVPIYVLPAWIQSAGEWTPNGLALSALLNWLQTENSSDLVQPLLMLSLYMLIALGAAIWIFPRKGHKP